MEIDLNCDMGESFGAYTIGSDAALMRHINSANIACGYHASDPLVMEATVKLAAECRVQVGAHPSYPDLVGFGRRTMAASPAEIEAFVLYQVGALWAFARANGVSLQHVKPHGALYNVAAKDQATAHAIARGIARFSKDIIIVGLSRSALVAAGREHGLRVAEEAFADRGYNVDGTLQSRQMPGSVIHDPKAIAERVIRMVQNGEVVAHTGETVKLRADTICIHGDNPAAADIVPRLVETLKAAGVVPRPMGEFV